MSAALIGGLIIGAVLGWAIAAATHDARVEGPVVMCACGTPASQQVTVGNVRRGGRWQIAWAWMCDQCAAESDREREAARAS